MQDPIWVRTGHHYWTCSDAECNKRHSGSYSDLWTLVELAGFPICKLEEIKWGSDRIYLNPVVNGEYNYPNMFPSGHTCRMIQWILERPDINQPFRDERFTGSWVSDRSIMNACPEFLKHVQYVTLGSDKRLATLGMDNKPMEKLIDFSHLSYMTNRRQRVLYLMTEQGKTFAPNSWGADRHRYLRQSKAMLATHQDNRALIEPLRYALAWAYDLPILAERSADFHPFEETTGEPIPGLPELKWIRLKDGVEYDFRKCVEAAL